MNVRKTQTGGGPAKTPGDAQSTNNANIVANMRKQAQATAVMQRAGVPGGYPTLGGGRQYDARATKHNKTNPQVESNTAIKLKGSYHEPRHMNHLSVTGP